MQQTLDYTNRITSEPGKLGGAPCIRGHRMSVYDVLGYLASGMSYDELLEDFPFLEREDIVAALQYIDEEVHVGRSRTVATP
jgi:uncharacterized protein (DUF433 family)